MLRPRPIERGRIVKVGAFILLMIMFLPQMQGFAQYLPNLVGSFASSAESSPNEILPPGTIYDPTLLNEENHGSCPTRSDTSPNIESNSSTASPDNLLPISGNWTAKVEIPTLFIMGNPVGGYVEQTYTVGTNGLTVVDSDGNRFNGFTMMIDGSPVNIMSSSLIGNSTEAIQNFTVSTSLVPDAKISVVYSIAYQFCQPSGLSINFLGNLGLPSTLPDQTFGINFLGVPSNVASTTSWFTSNNGVVGTRIGFDWSDSIAHSPHFSSLTNSLTWNVNSNFTIDPEIVANTGVQQLGEYDHLLWYSQNLWWFFYSGEHTCTGSPCLYSLNYSTSPNGLQWTSQGTFATYSLASGLVPQFDIAVSGSTVTYVEDVQANNSFAWRQGILTPSGSIFWSGPQTFWSPALTHATSSEFPSVSFDTQSRFWFVIPEQSGPLNGAQNCPCYSDVYWLSNGIMHESSLFLDSSGSSWTPSASQILGLSNGEVALVTCVLCFPYNDTTKSGASITEAYSSGQGSSWSNPIALTGGSDDPVTFASEALGSTVVVAYDDYTTHQVVKAASLAYGSSNPTITNVESTTEPCNLGQTASCIGVTMTKDSGGNLAITVGDPNSTANSVKVYKSTNSGASWSLFETLTWQATFEYVNSITQTPSVYGNGLTGLGWEQGSGSTKNIVFASFPIVVPNPSIYANSWSRPGGSPYETYFSHIDDAISPGNGLLVLRQDDLSLPGRNGLDVMISRIFETPFAFGPGNYTAGYDNYTLANFGLGWQLNFPWIGNNYLHLSDGQAYVYQWNSSGVFENHAGTDFVMYHWINTNNTYDLYMADGTHYHFFSNQSLAYETDPTGNNTITFYYSSGHISSIVDDVGRTISFSYNSNGEVSSISSGGIQYSYGYNSTTGNLISVTDPLGRVTNYAYKSGINSWLLTNVTYPTGGQTIFTYGKEAVGTEDWAYFVTLAAVYTSSNVVDESNSYSYVASNGIISFTNETTADQAGKVQSYDIYQFPSGNNMYLLPITLTNSQTSAVGSGTQALINVNWNNYGSKLASNLQNAEFTDSKGIPLYAWCESNCSSSSTSSNVWVKLDQSIPAGQIITIYLAMNSLASNNFAGGFWGECPTCSPYYAQYDNGAKVFNFYDNFVGTTLSSSWTESGLTYSVNDGFSATAAPGSIPELITSSAEVSPGDAIDYNGTVYQSGSNWAEVGAITGTTSNYGSFIQSLSVDTYGQQQSSLGKTKSSNLATTQVAGVWSVEITSSSASSYQLNYRSTYTVSSDAPSYPSYFGFKADQAALLSPAIRMQWIRLRTLPPNNVMPTVAFGTIQGPSAFNPTSSVYVPITVSNWVSSSISSGTQVLVNIDWQSIEPFVANNLQNVEFYDSSHNPVYAWCESGCSNTSASSNVWIKLDQSIGAGQSVTYYLGIGPSSANNLSPTGYWGLNPTATPTYGQYDNGAKVFNFYDNFAGTSFASGWTIVRGSPSANNGLTIPASSVLTETSTSFSIYGSSLDAYVSSISYGTSGINAGFGMLQDVNGGPYTAPSSTAPYWVQLSNSAGQSYNAIFDQYSNPSNVQAVVEKADSFVNAGTGPTITNAVWSLVTTPYFGTFCVNYVPFSSSNLDVPPLGNYYVSLGASINGSTTHYQWLRIRTTPPNNVIPQVSVGQPPTENIHTILDANQNRLRTVVTSYDSFGHPIETQVYATTPSALAIDGSASDRATGTTSDSITLSTKSSPDVVIVYGLSSSPGVTMSISDASKLTWHTRVSDDYKGNTELYEFYAIAPSALSSDKITVTQSSSATLTLIGFGVAGANTTSPYDPNSSLPGIKNLGTTYSPGATISTSSPIDMIIGLLSSSGQPSVTPASGFSIIVTNGLTPEASSEYQVAYSSESNLNVGFSLSSAQYTAVIADAIVQASPSWSSSNNSPVLLYTTYNSYDNWGNVISTTDAIGHNSFYSYANTNSYNTFAGAGNSFTNSFYTNNTVVSKFIHDALVGEAQLQNGAGSAQMETYYDYNSAGEMLHQKELYINGTTDTWLYSSLTYDSYGNVLTSTDPLGRVTTYQYSSTYDHAYLTNQSIIVNGKTISQTYAYNFATGWMTSQTNGNGQTTSYSYDNLGRETMITYPAIGGVSAFTQYAYNDQKNTVNITDPDGNLVVQYYDGIGREIEVQIFNGSQPYSREYYTYNYQNQVANHTTPTGQMYSYLYDALGRQIEVINPDGTKEFTTYDTVLNSTTYDVVQTNENGFSTYDYYNWANQLVLVQEPATNGLTYLTRYSYDQVGNLLTTTDANNHVTAYQYDNLNRLIVTKYPDGTNSTNTYDGVDNIIKTSDPSLNLVTYTYDALNRLTQVQYPNGATDSYTYDNDGNKLSMIQSSPATSSYYTYDARDRLTNQTDVIAGVSYTTLYTYDKASNILSITYPDRSYVNLTYDSLNRIKTLGTNCQLHIYFG